MYYFLFEYNYNLQVTYKKMIKKAKLKENSREAF